MRKEQKIRLGVLGASVLLVAGLLWDGFHRFPAVNTVLTTLTRPISFVVGGSAEVSKVPETILPPRLPWKRKTRL